MGKIKNLFSVKVGVLFLLLILGMVNFAPGNSPPQEPGEPLHFTGMLNLISNDIILRACVDKPIRFFVKAAGKENGVFTYSDPLLPEGASIDPVTRLFSWVPSARQEGETYELNFQVLDGQSSIIKKIFIEVLPKANAVDL